MGRIGIATAKKIGCHARRNWVKRRIRESINSLESHLKPQIDYTLIASPSVVLLSFEETTAALQDALDRMASRWAEVSEFS